MGDIYGFGTPVKNDDGTYTVSQNNANDWTFTQEVADDLPARITRLRAKGKDNHADEFQDLLDNLPSEA